MVEWWLLSFSKLESFSCNRVLLKVCFCASAIHLGTSTFADHAIIVQLDTFLQFSREIGSDGVLA